MLADTDWSTLIVDDDPEGASRVEVRELGRQQCRIAAGLGPGVGPMTADPLVDLGGPSDATTWGLSPWCGDDGAVRVSGPRSS